MSEPSLSRKALLPWVTSLHLCLDLLLGAATLSLLVRIEGRRRLAGAGLVVVAACERRIKGSVDPHCASCDIERAA